MLKLESYKIENLKVINLDTKEEKKCPNMIVKCIFLKQTFKPKLKLIVYKAKEK